MTEIKKIHRAHSFVQHRGLLINLASIFLVIGVKELQLGAPAEFLSQQGLLFFVLVLLFVLEPWAIYYSMRGLNQRRSLVQLPVPWVQRKLKGTLGILLWAGRMSIYGAFLISLLNLHYGSMEAVPEWLHLVAVISIFIRESFIIYWFIGTKAPGNFNDKLDFVSDLILLVGLVLGEFLVFQVFKDFGLNGSHTPVEYIELLFPILLLCFIFYLPIRFFYTLEDLTFAQTSWERWERLISFLLVFISFLVLGPGLVQ